MINPSTFDELGLVGTPIQVAPARNNASAAFPESGRAILAMALALLYPQPGEARLNLNRQMRLAASPDNGNRREDAQSEMVTP